MATLLGVILFMSWYSVSLARNLITYLESRPQRGQCLGHPFRVVTPFWVVTPSVSPPRALLAPGSPDVVVVGFGQLLAGVPESLQPLLLLRDAAGRWDRALLPSPPCPGAVDPPSPTPGDPVRPSGCHQHFVSKLKKLSQNLSQGEGNPLDAGPLTPPRLSEPTGNIPNAVNCARKTPNHPRGSQAVPPVPQSNGGMSRLTWRPGSTPRTARRSSGARAAPAGRT